jgi:hypothetical protein
LCTVGVAVVAGSSVKDMMDAIEKLENDDEAFTVAANPPSRYPICG